MSEQLTSFQWDVEESTLNINFNSLLGTTQLIKIDITVLQQDKDTISAFNALVAYCETQITDYNNSKISFIDVQNRIAADQEQIDALNAEIAALQELQKSTPQGK